MADSATEFAAVSLGITQSLSLWTVLMPPLSDVKQGSKHDEPLASDMRHAEIVVTGIAILVGAIGSMVLKSPLPILATVSTVAGLAFAYEMTLASPPVNSTEKEISYV